MMSATRMRTLSWLWSATASLLVALASEESSHSWPSFYDQGEATAPTQSILEELREYESSWRVKQSEEGFGRNYSFTMSWGCSPCPSRCLEANRFVRVFDGEVQSVETSQLNDASQLAGCGSEEAVQEQYKSIDELYALVLEWVASGVAQPDGDFLIIALRLHPTYFFPMQVKLSQSSAFIAWDIVCFAPALAVSEEEACEMASSAQAQTASFWIDEDTQRWLGWSMVLLILMACSLGYCINWLKKKKAHKIDAWREREERERYWMKMGVM